MMIEFFQNAGMSASTTEKLKSSNRKQGHGVPCVEGVER